MTYEKKKFIYTDLNGIEDYFLPWTTLSEWKRILLIYPNIQENDTIPLWTDDGDDGGMYDPLVYEGVFCTRNSSTNYGFKIEVENIEHLSKSKKYSEYSVKDVIGDDYEIERKAHSEIFGP